MLIFNHKSASSKEVDSSVNRTLGYYTDLKYIIIDCKKLIIAEAEFYLMLISKVPVSNLMLIEVKTDEGVLLIQYYIDVDTAEVRTKVKYIFDLFNFAGDKMKGRHLKVNFNFEIDMPIIFLGLDDSKTMDKVLSILDIEMNKYISNMR